MSSYIYSKVREAIGGNSISSGFQKGWSPNSIRSLFIMRDFILVVDYLKGPKLIKLNVSEVSKDLQNRNRVGSLNNLLSSRQLSCLEEIYADDVYARYDCPLNLKEYAESIVNSASRLRYYSYVSGLNGDELYKLYYKVFSEGITDFTYANEVGNIGYEDTGNIDWYAKHNLRPQYYGPDAEGGKLMTWFNKVEKEESKKSKNADIIRNTRKSSEYIVARVLADISVSKYIGLFNELIRICQKAQYPMFRGVADICIKYRSSKAVEGLTKDMIVESMSRVASGSCSAVDLKGLIGYYLKVGILSKDGSFNVNSLIESNVYPEGSGFLKVGEMLDRVLAEIYRIYSVKNENKYAILMGIHNNFPNGVPAGKLSERLGSMVKPCYGTPQAYLDNYMEAIYNICGRSCQK